LFFVSPSLQLSRNLFATCSLELRAAGQKGGETTRASASNKLPVHDNKARMEAAGYKEYIVITQIRLALRSIA
jgi:hypothetical protein